jgi:hypothetical protein
MIVAFDTLISKALPNIVTIFPHESKTQSMDSEKMGSDMVTPMTSELNPAPDDDLVTVLDAHVGDIASQLIASPLVETDDTVDAVDTFGRVSQVAEEGGEFTFKIPEPEAADVCLLKYIPFVRPTVVTEVRTRRPRSVV